MQQSWESPNHICAGLQTQNSGGLIKEQDQPTAPSRPVCVWKLSTKSPVLTELSLIFQEIRYEECQ